MALLIRHLFTGGAGTFALNGASPNTVNSMPGGATTFGFAAGTCTLDGLGYATADAARVVKINIPSSDQTTHDWIIGVRAKYDKATPSTSDNFEFGVLTGTSDTQQYFVRCTYNSTGTNYYTMQMRRLPAAVFGSANIVGENTTDIDGNNITVGTNPTAGDVWFYVKKVGTSFYCGFDVGRGTKWFTPATDSTFAPDGVPWFSLYSGTWKVAEVILRTATDKNIVLPGNFDPTIDPRTMSNLRRHFDMDAEIALANPYVGGWWPGQNVGTNPWVSATNGQTGKFTNGFKWSAGSGNVCWYPGHGLVAARKVTIGIWIHLTVDWASWTGGTYIIDVGDNGNADAFSLRRSSATQFIWNFIQKIGATVGSTDLTMNFPFGDVPVAGDDVLFTLTIRSDGHFEMGVNSNLATGNRGGFTGGKIVAGQWIEASTNLAGLLVGYHVAAGTRNANCNFSDIFVLVGDHYPNHPIPAALPNTLTVTPSSVPAGIALSAKHIGVLGSSITNGGAWETFTAGKLGLTRDSAKKLLATPFELSSGGNGSTATQRAPGAVARGSMWWLDKQVIQRDVTRDAAAVYFGGTDWGYMLVGLGGVPRRMQDAGGTLTAYYSGTNLTTNTSQSQSFVANIPNYNATNTGTIAGHTVVLSTGANSTCDAFAHAACDTVDVIYETCDSIGFPRSHVLFNFWNEGDTGSFWKTTNCFTNQRAELAKLYNAAYTKIVAAFPGFKMSFIPSVQYASADINAMMAAVHTATNDAGIDAIDIHDYQGGSYSGVDFLVRTADADRITNSIASALPTVISEDGMNNIITPGFGGSYFQVGDNPPTSMASGMAWTCHRILACAKSKATSGKTLGISQYVLTAATMNTLSAYGATGLLTAGSGFPTCLLNLFDLLCRMATDLPGTTGRTHGVAVWDGVPGIGHICTVLADGTVRVLVVNFRTRPDSTETVNIQLPVGYANRRVNHYVVDDQNGSYFDTAGVSNNIPNPTQTVLDATGLMTVSVRGQSVTLHEVTLLLGGGSYATAAGAMRGAGIKIGGVGIR